MLNYFKKATEFVKLTKSFNGVGYMIKDLIKKREDSIDESEYYEDFLIVAFISKVGIIDRMEKYEWSLYDKLTVPSIHNNRVTLAQAYSSTIGILRIIAVENGWEYILDNIFNKGEAYYDIEKKIPYKILKDI